jgi:hypothetical protein
MCLILMWVDKSYCFSSFSLGLIFNILPSLGHLKTFSGHELPLHFSITPRSAITRHDNLGGGLHVHIYVFCQTNKTYFEIDYLNYGMLTYQYAHTPHPQLCTPPQLLHLVTALTPPNHNTKQFWNWKDDESSGFKIMYYNIESYLLLCLL